MTAILWLVCAASAALTLAILFLGGFGTTRQAARTVAYTGAAGATAAAYALMATGIGATVEETGAPVEMAVFGAWLVSTPLVLVGLALTATPVGHKTIGETAALVFAGAAMVVAFAIGTLVSGLAAWVWFVVGIAALGAALLLLWGPLKENSEDGHPVREQLYMRHAGVLSGLLLLYPLVFLLSPHFGGAIGFGAMAVLLAALDFGSRAAFGLLVVLEDDNLLAAEAQERGWDPRRDAAAVRPGMATPGAAAPQMATAPSLRDRMLARYHESEAQLAAATRLRGGLDRVRAVGRDQVRRAIGPARRPAPRPPEPVRRRKPSGGLWRTPFGPLQRTDIVPVAAVATALLLIARQRKD
ncbi:bacteriorhodopsin [Acuticoccus sp. MNP-M23]|uniref:bacteriorhodopsin n=1 Tax=Acuticoccus sp. MNP-M23 TaxID=3072793 RepID=UPI0028157B15|nr:bacteriorhodopsin [Acuticoccus sp. MNP-M23]WMS44483.1 bacteriorhodopsin [Acuticoccus sp. MNP-M23]